MKRKGFVYAVIPLLFITTKVNALSAIPSVSCNSDSITTSSNITCEVGINVSSGSISAFSGEYTLSSNLELVSSSIESSKWQGSVEGNKVGVYTSDGYTSNTKIATLTLKLKDTTSSTANVTINNMTFTDENFTSINYSGTVNKNLTVTTSTNNNTTNDNESSSSKSSSSKSSSSKDEEDSKSPSTKTTTTEEVQKNPDTGVFAPIVTLSILGGITLLILIYSKKKTLFKKI